MALTKNQKILAAVGCVGCLGLVFIVALVTGGLAFLAMNSDETATPAPQEQGGAPVQTEPAPVSAPVAGGDDAAAPTAAATEAATDPVLVQGRVVDAATQQGVPNLVFVVLKPGVTVAQYDAAPVGDETNALILAVGQTDASGNYRTQVPLPRGQTYSVIVGGEGYTRMAQDNVLEITAEDPNPVSMKEIALSRS